MGWWVAQTCCALACLRSSDQRCRCGACVRGHLGACERSQTSHNDLRATGHIPDICISWKSWYFRIVVVQR
jgi:hypothetical protein